MRIVGLPDATPAPTAKPTARPTAPPTATPPTPTPVKVVHYESFVVGDYIFSPKVYNELNPGTTATGSSYGSWAGRAGAEFPLFGIPWMLEGDMRYYQYPHPSKSSTVLPCPQVGDPGCVTVITGVGQVYVPWINWALLVGVITLVLTFRSSASLAYAYGTAVTGTTTAPSSERSRTRTLTN